MKFQFNKIALLSGILLCALGIFAIFSISLPLLIKGTHESNPSQVLLVHTENYRLGAPNIYPIGALDWKNNLFRIENKSNENIRSFFILELENVDCEKVIQGNIDNGKDYIEIFLPSFVVTEIPIPINIASHQSEFIEISLQDESCSKNVKQDFPIAIHGWKFSDK